ncbi:MAG: hypothetical protein ACHQ49_07855 [Elusimicrobiota bacterium]
MATAFLASPVAASAAAPPGSVKACLDAAAAQPRTVFDVVVGTYPTVVERRLAIGEINGIRPVRLPPQAIAHGLSIADYRLRYHVKSEATCWEPGGHACVWLGSVVVNLTPDSIRIYIPKEYPADGCESKALLLHEREHERLHRRGIERAAEAMRAALSRAKNLPGPLTPIGAANPDDAYARLKTLVDKVVRPIFEDFLRASQAEQDALDTPATYRRLGAACSGWKKT